MFTFKKYNSIENSYRKEYIDKIRIAGLDEGTFHVQEKVHGANFSIWTDGSEVKFAKRTAFIGELEAFYNYKILVPHMSEVVLKLYKELNQNGEKESVVLFGELFGGMYPHPDVEKDNRVHRVQSGVFYSPHIEFYAFDIKYGDQIIGMQQFIDLAEQFDLLYAKPLFSGSFKDALEYQNDFQTTIPGILGLPEIEDNIAEGVVIKPENAMFFHDGSRLILKNKNAKFGEKSSAKEPKEKSFDFQATPLFQEMAVFVTENRLDNVISKIGEVSIRDFGKVLREFNLDVLEDYKKEHGEKFASLEKEDQKILQRTLNKFSSSIVREYLLRQ